MPPANSALFAPPTPEELAQAAMFAPPTAEELAAAKPGSSLGEKVETGARSALEGATLGLSEPVISGANAVIGQGIDALMNEEQNPLKRFTLAHIKKAYDEDVERRRGLKDENPGLSTGTEIAGAVLPALATGGGSIVGKVGASGAKAAEGLAAALPGAGLASRAAGATGALGSAASSIAKGAIGGAGSGLAFEGAKQAIERPTGFLKEGEGASLPGSALVGGALGGAAGAIPGAISLAGGLAKKMGSAFGGVSPATITEYLADPAAIKSAKTVPQIKELLDGAVAKVQKGVEDASLTRDQAKEALSKLQDQFKDISSDARLEMRQAKFDTGAQLSDAKRGLDSAFKEQVQELKSARAPTRLADDVLDSIQDLKQQVVQGSKESYDLLGKAEGEVNIRSLPQIAAQVQRELKVGTGKGAGPVSDTAKAAYDKIETFKETLKGLPETISYPDAKKLVQQLDSDIKYINRTGGFSDEASQSLIAVRRGVDGILKEVPGYADKMADVRDKTRLLSELSEKFGTRESALSKLSRIDSPSLAGDRAMLGKLGETTGKDFQTPLEEYLGTRAKLASPDQLETMKRGLPEYQDYQKSLRSAAAQSPEAQAQELAGRIGKTGIQNQLTGAEGDLARAQAGVESAKATAEPFRSFTPETTEGKILQLMGGRKTEDLKLKMGLLSKLSDIDFLKVVHQASVANEFTKEFHVGSQHVNLWGLIGMAAGSAEHGLTAGAAGAVLGSMVTKFGPAMTKQVLDGISKIQGIPTVQKIASLSLPDPIKEELSRSLIRATLIGNEPHAPVHVPQEQRQALIQDIHNAQGMSNVDKARNISSLNKNGTAPDLRAFISATKKPPAPEPEDPSDRQDRRKPERSAQRLKQNTDFIQQRRKEDI